LETDPGIRKHREDLRRLLRQLEAVLGQSDTTLDAMTSAEPTADSVRELDRLRVELEQSVKDYLAQNMALLDYIREHVRKIEDANQKASMAEKRSTPPRNDAQIQELSEKLATELRLERVDSAIKELLDFLSDADFFAANATTGRRRRLRALQNAIDKALQK
jgi:hypothetical protein